LLKRKQCGVYGNWHRHRGSKIGVKLVGGVAKWRRKASANGENNQRKQRWRENHNMAANQYEKAKQA